MQVLGPKNLGIILEFFFLSQPIFNTLANTVSNSHMNPPRHLLLNKNKSRVNDLLVSILVSTTPPQSTHHRAQVIILPHKSDYITCQGKSPMDFYHTQILKNLTMEGKTMHDLTPKVSNLIPTTNPIIPVIPVTMTSSNSPGTFLFQGLHICSHLCIKDLKKKKIPQDSLILFRSLYVQMSPDLSASI